MTKHFPSTTASAFITLLWKGNAHYFCFSYLQLNAFSDLSHRLEPLSEHRETQKQNSGSPGTQYGPIRLSGRESLCSLCVLKENKHQCPLSATGTSCPRDKHSAQPDVEDFPHKQHHLCATWLARRQGAESSKENLQSARCHYNIIESWVLEGTFRGQPVLIIWWVSQPNLTLHSHGAVDMPEGQMCAIRSSCLLITAQNASKWFPLTVMQNSLTGISFYHLAALVLSVEKKKISTFGVLTSEMLCFSHNFANKQQ